MASFRCLVIISCLLLHLERTECQNDKLKDRINKDERLSRFSELLSRSQSNLLEAYLGTDSLQYTVFAPTNEAFDKLPEITQNNLLSLDPDLRSMQDEFLKYHIIKGEKLHTSQMQTVKFKGTMERNQAKVFFNIEQATGNFQGGTFVNQAKIIQPNTDASNGYLHIIDSYLYPRGSGLTMYGYLPLPASPEVVQLGTRKFMEMLNYLPSSGPGGMRDQLSERNQVTMFVPTDEALNKIPTAKWNELMADTTKLQQVIESHIILGKVYYSTIVDSMGDEGAEALRGRIVGRTIGNNVFVKSNNIGGRVVLGDITVANGVLHMVDNILNFTYFNVYSHISQDRNLQQLTEFVNILPGGGQVGTGVMALLQNEIEEMTMFAPVDSAFRNVETAVNLRANMTLLDTTMKLHIVRQKISYKDLKNETTLNSVNSKQLKFIKGNNGTFIIGGRIKARIVEPDVGVTNGIIHYIDTVMGIATKNLKQEIESNDELGYMNSMLITVQPKTDLFTALGQLNNKFTLFLPNNVAWEQLYNKDTGKSLIDKEGYRQNLVWVLQRHMVKGKVIYSDSSLLQPGANVDLNTELSGSSDIGQITVKKIGDCNILGSCDIRVLYKGVEARVVSQDIEARNGVIHIIDKVLMDDPEDLLRGNVSSSAWLYYASICLTLFLGLISGLLIHL